MTKLQRGACGFLLTLVIVQWSSAQEETALEQLVARGAKPYYDLDDKGEPTSKLIGIGIPFDWMGNEYSLDLIRDIPLAEGEQLYLKLIGPTDVSPAKIKELKSIPGWTVARTPAVFVGIATDQSSMVTAIHTGSAADQCGIKVGDRILKVNEIEVLNLESIPKAISKALLEFRPGDQVTITFEQDGSQKTATAKLTELPEPGARITINNRSP